MDVGIKTIVDAAISFHVTHVIELFPPPLPTSIDDLSLETGMDLFGHSPKFGFDELYLAAGKTVQGESQGDHCSVPIEEFLRWQLERMGPKTLWHLVDKVQANVIDILNFNSECERDPDYSPAEWLDVDEEGQFPGKGVEYIERLVNEQPQQFFEILTDAILDDRCGLLNKAWYETEIKKELTFAREIYEEWQAPLMVVSVGNFLVTLKPTNYRKLVLDKLKITRMYVRNCEEG
jgi:hypothetical protein